MIPKELVIVPEYCINNNNVKILYTCSKGEASLQIGVDNEIF